MVQLVTRRNSEISAALLAEPDAVTFTGSNEVGAFPRRTLADRNVRLQAELGGKNPRSWPGAAGQPARRSPTAATSSRR